jgi:MerR family transcriptional regulator, heat shock protein HspR
MDRRRADQRASDRMTFDDDQGVFMISVAAELAGMHPQTLRIYESRGLIKPKRSPKQTRLYSQRDVERLRRIQELTTEVGLNLAGVERVLELERAMNTMQRELERMHAQAEQLEREMLQRIQEVHRSYKRELVRWEPPGELQRTRDFEQGRKPPVRNRVERRRHAT